MEILTKDQLKDVLELYNIKTTEDSHSAVKDLMREILQSTLDTERYTTPGYKKYDTTQKQTDNIRNGYCNKGLKSSLGEINIDIPRDRHGEHKPQIIGKGQSDISSIEDRIISIYGSGVSTRDINKHMQEIYGVNVSAKHVSKITDKIYPKIKEWQNRRLYSIYPIVYMVCKNTTEVTCFLSLK